MLYVKKSVCLYLVFFLTWLPHISYAQVIQSTSGESVSGGVNNRHHRQVMTLPGNDKVISESKFYQPDQAPGSSFSFEDAPIADVVRTIIGDVVKNNFILHPPIQGAVTLNTRNAVTADDAIFMLESALLANGLVMAKDTRGTYHIGRPDVVKNVGIPVRQSVGKVLPPGYGAIIVQLKYIGASEMAVILKPMIPGDAILRVDSLRNLLVLVGNRSQAEGWLNIVSTFDVDILQGMSVGVFPLRYISVADVELALKLFSTPSATPQTPAVQSGVPAQTSPQSFSQSSATNKDVITAFGAMRVVPLEQINSVLVVTPIASYLETARTWIEKLDKPNVGSTEPQLHVYPVQNGSAKYLSSVLIGLFGDGKAGVVSGASGVAPALQTVTGTTRTNNTVGGNNSFVGSGSSTAGSNNALANKQVPTAGTLFGNIRVMSDDINNMILVWSSYSDFAKIETTLKRLDLPPTQVLIEASIVEVTLTDELQYGLQWKFTDSRKSSADTGTGVLSSVGGGVLGSAAAGFSYTFKNSLGDVRAVLNALAEKSLVKVISSPSLMVLDNHLATISVGNQQPIKAGETVGSDGILRSTNIQYKDTGVNLAVTPSVNSSNLVSMQIDQNVTDVGAVDSATGQRAFLQRQISSKVAIRSGETLVLGGLIRDNSTSGKSGVPLLQDIPLIGNLFATNSSNGSRTELLVVITPRVVRSDIDLRSVGNELREKMQGIKLAPFAGAFDLIEGK